jgi:uncharacterized protein (DUF302 family)
MAISAASGLITKPSKYSVQETIERFETAIQAQGGVVFMELDHAAAAAQAGLALHPRTVIVFGNPKFGTPLMQQAPTLAIDAPLKALVWQDEQGQVWLTYNSSAYMGICIYPRHGLTVSADALKHMEQLLNEASDQSTRWSVPHRPRAAGSNTKDEQLPTQRGVFADQAHAELAFGIK